jgi:hypothetical protein
VQVKEAVSVESLSEILILTNQSLIDYSTTCKIGSSDLNNCIKKSLEENFASLHNPEPDANYPFVDPFYFKKGKLYLNQTRALRGYFAVKNMTVFGGSKARVKTVDTFFDKQDMMVSVRLLIKQINATGLYKTNVTFSDAFSFISRGNFNTTFDNIILDFMLDGSFMHKHRFNVTRLEMMPSVQNMKFSVTGLVKDSQSSEFVLMLIERLSCLT